MTSQRVLDIFKEILTIPRESGHEELIGKWLVDWAAEHKLACKTDKAGNVCIIKEAAPGKENVPAIVLQSHMDMVCEKNDGVEHDFAKDPIKAVVEDGWLVAKDTTLGADCGIGIAASLAVLEDENLKLGKVEAIFTVSEETALVGANAMEADFFSGKILINLDSEDEGELFIGCSGGMRTMGTFTYTTYPATDEYMKCEFKIHGAQGGHSGDDIDKNRANAVKLLGRFLVKLINKFDIELYEIGGGNKDNAIAREAHAVIGFSKRNSKAILRIWKDFVETIKLEYKSSDAGIDGFVGEVGIKDVKSGRMMGSPKKFIDPFTASNVIRTLAGMPHGVIAMSNDIKGLVETSTNLASVKMLPRNRIAIETSQRSSLDHMITTVSEQVEAVFDLACADVKRFGRYPGWQPKLESDILEITKASYRKLFGNEPVVRAIHAGLECGLFLNKMPDLDMISFGPTLRSVHAPGEKLNLATVDKFVVLLEDVVKSVK